MRSGLFSKNMELMLIALSFSILLWLFVGNETEAKKEIDVAVRYTDIPAGLVIVNNPPAVLRVRIEGPKVLLWWLQAKPVAVSLDLKGAGEGVVTFAGLDKAVHLSWAMQVTRVYPSEIDVRLGRAQ